MEDVDALFDAYSDVWEGVKDYYDKYHVTPSVDVIESTYRDFEPVDTKAPTAFYVDQLKADYQVKKIRAAVMKVGSMMGDAPPEKIIEFWQKEGNDLAKFSHVVKDVNLTDYEDAERHLEAVRARSEKMGGSPGIKTGFPSIDLSYPTGFAPGHYVVAIGYPSRGKTWFTSYLAVKAWEQGYKPMIVSLEMSPEDMRNRIYGLMGSGFFKVSDFQQGSVDLDVFRGWGQKNLVGKNDFIVVSSEGDVSPSVIQGKIDQHRPDIIICDYMQLMTDNRKSETLTPRMMNLSRELKLLAVNNNIPVMAISAVTMDDTGSQDDPPRLSQVAWSKAIEYDADMAMSIHRHTDTNVFEVVSAKNRHGPDFALYLEVDLNLGIIKEHHGDLDFGR